MKRMIFFDKKNNRLAMFGDAAVASFWDDHWRNADFKNNLIKSSENRLVADTTAKYLASGEGKKILEGGCGDGRFVYGLARAGYDAYGVDFAKETIEMINKELPELKVYLGDLRKLAFPDSHFDGYWSIGVIEHFYDGYDAVLSEMKRVLKSGGYLFLTFPAMSPIRKLKILFGCYKPQPERIDDLPEFYQFFLNADDCARQIEASGFKLLEKKYTNGSGGIKRELSFFARGPFKKYLVRAGKLLEFFFGHSALLVFIKK